MSASTDKRAWSLIEPYWSSLNQSWDDGASQFLEHLQRVPVQIGHMYSGNWCVSEVDNGGFLQFFWNTTGILAPEAAACFKCMGAAALGTVVLDAMKYFGPIYPRDRETRLIVLGGDDVTYPKSSPFETQDKAFYRWFERNGDWKTMIEQYAQGA